MNAKDPTKLRQVGGKDITFLKPTTNDAGDVIYPAVTEPGEPSPEHDIRLPKAGKTKTQPAEKDYTKQQKIDDLASFYNSKRLAAATVAKERGSDVAGDVAQLDLHHRQERRRIEEGRPTAFEIGQQLDPYGYYTGEERKAPDGTMMVYSGDNIWLPKGAKKPEGVGTPRNRGYR